MEVPRLEDIDVPPLPPGYAPLEVAAVVKCFDDAGNVTLAIRTSSGLMAWEAIGMFTAASDMCRGDLQQDLTAPEPVEDEDIDDHE